MAAMAVSMVSSRASGLLIERPPSSRSTYLAITSTSRLTGSPGARAPSVVSRRVVGMRLTSNQGSGTSAALTALTVSETPSTAMEPFSTT